jgi:hypothetical protein
MAVADGAILKAVTSLLMPDDVIAQLVWAVVFADTGTSNDDQDVVDDIGTWLDGVLANVATYISQYVSAASHRVYVYDSVDDDFDEVGVASTSWIGTHTSSHMLPHGTAAIAHARTTDPDVQGTKFFPGFCENYQDQSNLTGAAVSALLAAANDWVTAFVGSNTGGDFGPGVWSPTRGTFYLANGDYSVNVDLGYQRRRKPGVGI